MKIIRKFAIIALCVCIVACTMYETPPPFNGDMEADEINLIFNRKVLWINIDGATGDVVQQVMPPNIARILKNSKYFFKGLSDANVLDDGRAEEPTNWTTLLTGVAPNRHTVKNRSYRPEISVDINNQDAQVNYFPNVFQYVKSADPLSINICITPWAALNSEMLSNTYLTLTSATDEDGKNSAIPYIKGDSEEDVTLVLVAFGDMLKAGREGGFTTANSAYVQALSRIDGYTGELIAAIEQRATFNDEDWLVVITSNHGGDANGSISTLESCNNFGIFYFPHYKEENFPAGKDYNEEIISGAFFNRTNSAFAIDTLELYSMGAGKSLSLEVMMYMHPKADGTFAGNNWDQIMGKSSGGIFRQRSTVSARLSGGSGAIEQAITSFNEPIWHSYIFGTRQATLDAKDWIIYYDGIRNRFGQTNASGMPSDTLAFEIGGTAMPTAFEIAVIRLWNIMLEEDDEVDELSKMINISENHPKYKNLISYWVFNPEELFEYTDKEGTVYPWCIRNLIQDGEPVRFRQEPVFTHFNNTLASYRRSNPVFENTLVLPQILYWLQIAVPSTLDGSVFLHHYAMDEQWRDKVD